MLSCVQVTEAPAVDEPDLSLRLKEELRERPEAEITTQVSKGTLRELAACDSMCY